MTGTMRARDTSAFLYFYAKRVGWRWEVWFRREDDKPDPSNGATEWRAVLGARFWSQLTATRVAQACQLAHNEGYWTGRCIDV